MDDNKVIGRKFDDGALEDVNHALFRAADITQTADELTDENAKFKLLEGVNIILADCIKALKERMKNGVLLDNEPIDGVMDYDD